MSLRQRGLGMLAVVLLVLTVAAFAVIVAASQSGSEVHGSDAGADSLQALLLAESGIDRALKRFATQAVACDNTLIETINDLSSIGLGNGTHRIAIGAGLTDDFASVPLPATQCRVQVTGTVLASNVSRTVHAIIDRNLLGGVTGTPQPTFNPTFNNPLAGTQPSAWTLLNPTDAFAAGGPDGTGPTNCTRSAWTAKNVGGTRQATGTATVQFTVAAGSPTTIAFDRRVLSRTVNCGTLPGAGAALPGACAVGGNSTVCFQLVGLNIAALPQTWTRAQNAAQVAGPGGAQCPAQFNPCSASYPAKTTLPVLTMTNAASISQIVYHISVQGGGRREMFLDNIEMTNPTAIGAAHVRMWRDCSNALNPLTCK
jgi:hypothetical protein